MLLPVLDSTIWTTKDGRKLTAAQMENDHLLNLIIFLQSDHFIGKIRSLLLENYFKDYTYPAINAEYAEIVYNQVADGEYNYITTSPDKVIFCDHIKPTILWESFFAEAKQRGLPYNILQ